MSDNSPITKSKGNIIIDESSVFQQCKLVSVVLLILIIPFCIGIHKVNPQPGGLPFFAFLILGSVIFTLLAYGFDGKYIFDTKLKEIRKEKCFLFQKSVTRICSFQQVRMLGVSAVLTQGKYGRIYEHFKVVIVFPGEPDKLVTLVDGSGISHTLNMEEINKIFLLLKETTGCEKCLPGVHGMCIKAVKEMNKYDYVQTSAEVGIY